MSEIVLREAVPEDLSLVRELFLEYARSLNFDLSFQHFDEELSTLPGKYSRPRGCILLAYSGGQPAGCIALRPFDATRCEMKRLFVRPAFRGLHLGDALIARFLHEARQGGYRSVLLDTVQPLMSTAIAMYKRLGFREIPPYCRNPVAGALFLELEL
ncbi:MAG TPA: GNAT family N-acetyltransferase [Candidatus Koribacter sp.]